MLSPVGDVFQRVETIEGRGVHLMDSHDCSSTITWDGAGPRGPVVRVEITNV